MNFIAEEERVNEAGHVSRISIYQATRCDGCPLRAQCHKSTQEACLNKSTQEPRRIEVNHRLIQY